MAATTYHFACKPDVPNEQYRTVYSKYQGTCASCNQSFATGDRVAYFPDSTKPRTQSAAPAGGEMEGRVAVLESKLNQFIGRTESILAQLQLGQTTLEKSVQQLQFKVYPELLQHMPASVQTEVRGNLAKPLQMAAVRIAQQTELVAEAEDAF